MNEREFGVAIAEQQKALIRYAKKRFHLNKELAEDLAQDTLLSAWKARERFFAYGSTNVKPWLYTILHNAILTYKRKAKQRMTQALENEEGETLEIPDPASQFDAVYLKQVMIEVNRLNPEQRFAMVLDARGLSVTESAAIQKICEGTVKSRESRAKTELQAVLDQNEANADKIRQIERERKILEGI